MLKQIKKNTFFIVPFIIIIIFVSIILVVFRKSDIHKYLNQLHNGLFDFVFRYITYLGDGFFVILVCIVLFVFSFRNAFYFLATYLSTGILVQILKRFIFDDIMRPVKYFEGTYDLYTVEGVKLYHFLSFPSGHSATTFGFFVCIAFITESRLVKLLCLILACLVAYSRIYLSQHFLVDVYAGSLIGITGAVVFYNMVYLSEKDWLDYSVLKLIRKRNEY